MEKPNKLELEKLEDVRKELQKIKKAIEKATVISENGTRIDLAELENSVQSVCKTINSVSKFTNSSDITPLIKTILKDFDILSKTLANQHKILTTNGG